MIKKLSLAFLLSSFLVPLFVGAQYCTPTTNCTEGDGIRLMAIGPYSNSSDCEADLDIPGYGDFTISPGLSLGQGVTYEAQFQSAYAGQQISIWIDMDSNESFEAEELILMDEVVGLDIVTTSVTIPATLPLGQYRMRVQATWNGPSSEDACVQGLYGETEDYTLTVTEPPSCLNVSGIEVTSLSATEATITWVDGGSASVWDVEWGPTGFTPTGMPTVGYDDISNPAVLSGLSPVSEYDVYIRADCGMDNTTDVSVWNSGFTFLTACGAVIPTYVEDFNDGLGACWETFGDGDLASGPIETDFANWFDDGFANQPNVFNGCQGISMFGANQKHWLVSPDVNLSTGGPYQVELDLSLTASFSQNPVVLGSDDEFRFLISPDYGATWQTLALYDTSASIPPSGEHLVFDLTAFQNSEVRFAYWASNGVEDNFLAWNAFVDNFRVQAVGSPMLVEIDFITEPNCFDFGNPLADVIISISGGVAPYTFEWSDGTSTEDLIDAEEGTYTLMVTDGEGTPYTSDPIDVPGTPVLSVIAIVTDETYEGADNGSIELTEISGGEGPYTFFWNNGDTEGSIDGLIDAIWCVDISDANGCETDTCFEVMEGLPSDLTELEFALDISIYPNPTADGLTQLSADLSSGDRWEMTIIDAMGKVIVRESLQGQASHVSSINLRGESKGIYTLLLTRSDDGARVRKTILR